ncbi:MAG TPA: hypothetical protein VIV60_32060 [Polyangiaceae bacterium]
MMTCCNPSLRIERLARAMAGVVVACAVTSITALSWAAGGEPTPAAVPSAAAEPVEPAPVTLDASAPATPTEPQSPAKATAMPKKSATDGIATVAPSTPAEKRAAALASEAMNKDFLAMAFDSAEKKLRRAIQICLQQTCTAPFRARLNRDIGVVYIVGMNKIEDGKDEFAAALIGDPTVAISPDMLTDEVNKAFLEVNRGLVADSQPSTDMVEPLEDTTPSAPSPDHATDVRSDEDAWRDVANWVSIGFQQDFVVHMATKYACNDNTHYRCYNEKNELRNYTQPSSPILRGNEINGTKVKLGTLRILAGYERLLSKNFSVGVKAGLIIAGKAPRLATDKSIFSYHLEGRGTYYPGVAPFAPSKLLRPYVFVTAGIAEVDSKISVEIYQQTQYSRVNAWKRSGRGFFGIGGGTVIALQKKHGMYVEAKLLRMLESTWAMALGAGYMYGF